MSNILVVTGDLNQDYMILDSIFAMDSHKGGFLSIADPSKAFEAVKGQLRKKASTMGGDAVINCMFEYRVSVADGLMGKKQVMEIFAYGTAVKRIQQTTPAPVAPAPAPVAPAPAPVAPAPAHSPTPTTPPPTGAPNPAYSPTPTTPPPTGVPNPFATQGMPSVDDIL